MKRSFLALVIAGCACSQGPAPVPVEPPVPASADAASTDAATPVPDAPAPRASDASTVVDARAPGDGSGRRVISRVRGSITGTEADPSLVLVTFERPVKKFWFGDLWDDERNQPVPGSRFQLVGVFRNGVDAAARLPKPLASYGAHRSVRVIEEFD